MDIVYCKKKKKKNYTVITLTKGEIFILQLVE